MKKIAFISLCIFVLSLSAGAQPTESNTLMLDSTAVSPKASISDIAWLAGHWRGEAFGGTVEEFWSPPLGGSMMGGFKLTVNEEVQFYELQTISEKEESLILRLKHFHKDLKGWEEKNETVDFPLVKITPGKVYFSGFTVEKISHDEINIYVVIGPEGKEKEQQFNYKRVKRSS